jgi:hypothetical protein
MMALLKGVVQAPSNISFSDGDEVNLIASKQAALMVANAHSELYSQTYRGNVYHASTTPLGLAIPIYTGTAPVVCLWNPIGSGKNFSILNVVFSYCSGTAAFSSIGLCYVPNAGSTIATGAVFSAFGSNNCLVNGVIGGGNASVARVATAGTTTLSTAPAAANWFYTLGGINLEAETGTAHVTFVPGAGSNPKGSIIVPPGTAIWIAGTKATTALYAQTISWAEVPQ